MSLRGGGHPATFQKIVRMTKMFLITKNDTHRAFLTKRQFGDQWRWKWTIVDLDNIIVLESSTPQWYRAAAEYEAVSFFQAFNHKE